MKAIRAEKLSKRYKILKNRAHSIKELILHHWFRTQETETIWALRDLDFAVDQGMTLGIIGANGSGKTTLLRVISGITEPTSGSVEVNGTVASLLELGAGFHPELSGMENIFLNGSVLGLSQDKIESVKDEIISFSQLEKFIHMPVKHYSSGMLMRLGFSVAVHVDPDILILDEVMAVGDAWFQERSAHKVKEFKKRGKTILLVTHNLDHAEEMCDAVLWLEKGKIRFQGPMEEAVTKYVNEFYQEKLKTPPIPFDFKFGSVVPSGRLGSGEVLITKVVFRDGNGHEVRTVESGKEFFIDVHYEADREGRDLEAIMGIGRFDDVSVTRIDTTNQAGMFSSCPRRGIITARFTNLIINRGSYRLSVALNPQGKPYEPYDMHLRFYEFRVSSEEENPREPVITHPVNFTLIES